MKKVFVFDFDGTLFNSGPILIEAFRHAVESCGFDFSTQSFENIRHLSPLKTFEALVGPVHEAKASQLLREYYDARKEQIEMFAGMKETLFELKGQGVALGLWTGRDRDSTFQHLEEERILELFSAIASGTCVDNNKPQADGLRKIMRELQCEGRSITMVGDHDHDILGAKAAGATAVLVEWQDRLISPPIREIPHHRFATVPEFRTWLGLTEFTP